MNSLTILKAFYSPMRKKASSQTSSIVGVNSPHGITNVRAFMLYLESSTSTSPCWRVKEQALIYMVGSPTLASFDLFEVPMTVNTFFDHASRDGFDWALVSNLWPSLSILSLTIECKGYQHVFPFKVAIEQR